LFRQLQREVVALRDDVRRLKARQYPQHRITSSGGGGSAVIAVCTACSYNDTTHSLSITASRLLSIPYTYSATPPDEDAFVAWAGVDGMIIPDMLVTIEPIVTIPGDTDIQYLARPIFGADRSMLSPPAQECLTEFVEPCAGDAVPNFCT